MEEDVIGCNTVIVVLTVEEVDEEVGNDDDVEVVKYLAGFCGKTGISHLSATFKLSSSDFASVVTGAFVFFSQLLGTYGNFGIVSFQESG